MQSFRSHHPIAPPISSPPVKPSRASGHERPVQPDVDPRRAAEQASSTCAHERPALSAEALFRTHASFVATFVVRLGVAPAHVDDLVQEVFITAHRRGGYQEGPAKSSTWLAEIAVRVVSTHKRTERRRRVVSDEGAVEHAVADADSPYQTTERRDALTRVQRALDALDDKHRAVFVLFELMGESCHDIAHVLTIPVGTVHSRLFAARRAFQAAHRELDRARENPIAAGGDS
jgi:RNA polymerase sigma-70 factor (ECF subfamily)